MVMKIEGLRGGANRTNIEPLVDILQDWKTDLHDASDLLEPLP
jgi:hypothetical protein